MTRVLVLNGPNLAGSAAASRTSTAARRTTTSSRLCVDEGAALGLDVEVRQTDDEAELVRLAARGGRRGARPWC